MLRTGPHLKNSTSKEGRQGENNQCDPYLAVRPRVRAGVPDSGLLRAPAESPDPGALEGKQSFYSSKS